MKVLLVRRDFWATASGGDQQVVNYATHLRAAGHAAAVLLTYGHEQNDEYSARLRQAGVAIYEASRQAAPHAGPLPELEFSLPGGEEPACYWACRALFERERPDIVHVIDCWQTLLAIRAAYDAGVPVLYQDIRVPRDRPLIQPTTWDYRGDMEYWYEELSWYLRLCAGALTLSPRLAALFRERLAYAGPLLCVPLIVPEPMRARPPLRSSAEEVIVGFAARFEVQKGPLVLLDAWAALLKRFPHALLRLAGAGEDEAELRARAALPDLARRCAFVSAYADPEGRAAFLAGLDVFVLPSYTEGTPNSVIEAMAHGLPVVATAVGGLPDVVTPECGLLVPPGDVGALAHALGQLVEDADLRSRLGRAARKRYEACYSSAIVTPQLVDAYRAILAGMKQ